MTVSERSTSASAARRWRSRRDLRGALTAVLLALLATLAVACGSGEDAAPQSLDFSARAVGEAFDPEVQPVVLNSALAAGQNRLALGFFRSDASLIP